MSSLTPEQVHLRSLELMYNSSHVVGIIPQSMVYGAYCILICIFSWLILKKGLKTRARRFLYGITLLMFGHATLYMAVSIGNLIVFIRVWFLDTPPGGSQGDGIQLVLTLLSAIGLVNYALTDGIVVWRAWVLCRDDSPKLLAGALLFLLLACVSVCTTIVIRILLFVLPSPDGPNKELTKAINITQVGNLAFSLITNSIAVTAVGIKAWHYRRFFTEMRVRDSSTHSTRVMALLIESGLLYCVSLITVLVSTVIRLPIGTLGDLYTPVNAQLAGIYPIVVLLLVNQDRSLDKTIFVNSVAMHASGMEQPSSGHHRRTDVQVPISSVMFRSIRSDAERSHTSQTTMPTTAGVTTSNCEHEELSFSGDMKPREIDAEKGESLGDACGADALVLTTSHLETNVSKPQALV